MKKRVISAEFWTDPAIVRLSPWARLCFIGLWQCADDDGRLQYEPERLKMILFPSDKVKIEKLIQELVEVKPKSPLVIRYQADGVDCLQVTAFSKHQKIDRRRPSRLPAPDCTEPRQLAPDSGANPRQVEENTERRQPAPNGAAQPNQNLTKPEPEPVTSHTPARARNSAQDALERKIERILKAWNKMALEKGLPEALVATGLRRTHMEERLRDQPDEMWWLEVIAGVPGKQRGGKFQPNIDWLFNDISHAWECLEAAKAGRAAVTAAVVPSDDKYTAAAVRNNGGGGA